MINSIYMYCMVGRVTGLVVGVGGPACELSRATIRISLVFMAWSKGEGVREGVLLVRRTPCLHFYPMVALRGLPERGGTRWSPCNIYHRSIV
jgi:hypothetical protein